MWGEALLQLLDPQGNEAENDRLKVDAISHFRKAIALEPSNAVGHFWLGQGLVMSRKEGDNEGNKRLVEEACQEFTKTLRLDPRNEDAKKAKERISCK
jgi:tetratricopeptide (TPR) repeat protein